MQVDSLWVYWKKNMEKQEEKGEKLEKSSIKN